MMDSCKKMACLIFLTANYSTKSLGSILLIYFLCFHLLQSLLSPDGFYLCCSDPLAIAPIQEVEKNLCDPEELRTAERLVDKFPVALSQHFPRIWSCLCTKFCNRKSILLSGIMCTERMLVFADLSSPALDSSTEHLKVEIAQDCRPVYWAAIQ